MSIRNSLSTQIEKRKQQAEERKIQERAEKAAIYLGRCTSLTESGITGNQYSIQEGDLLIVLDQGHRGYAERRPFKSLGIYFADNPVFRANLNVIDSYIPGKKWESKLDRMYKKIQRVLKATYRRYREKRTDRQERIRWGL